MVQRARIRVHGDGDRGSRAPGVASMRSSQLVAGGGHRVRLRTLLQHWQGRQLLAAVCLPVTNLCSRLSHFASLLITTFASTIA